MLRRFLVDEYIGGPQGVGSKDIDGLFLDDGWSDQPDPRPAWADKGYYQCDMSSTGGPTEEDGHCTEDMGLSHAEVQAIYKEWAQTLEEVKQSLAKHRAYSWALLQSSAQFGRNVSGGLPGAQASCASFLRSACGQGARQIQQAPLIYEFTGTDHVYDQHRPFFPLRAPEQDIAMFLLVRGPYAWIGTSWLGCVTGSDPASPGPGNKGPYSWPTGLDSEIGQPVDDKCTESSPGLFTRRWSSGVVSMDCNAWRGHVPV